MKEGNDDCLIIPQIAYVHAKPHVRVQRLTRLSLGATTGTSNNMPV